jgi:hypothetical protein
LHAIRPMGILERMNERPLPDDRTRIENAVPILVTSPQPDNDLAESQRHFAGTELALTSTVVTPAWNPQAATTRGGFQCASLAVPPSHCLPRPP